MVSRKASDIMNGKTNDRIKDYIEDKATVVCKLDELIKYNEVSLRELSRTTGIRVDSINDIMYLRRSSVNYSHLAALMVALNVSDLRDILEITEF